MEEWDPAKDEEVKKERRRQLNENYRETIISYLKMYGYEETGEPDSYFSFENEEKGLRVIVTKYQGPHSWRYKIDFYIGERKVHTEDVLKNDVGNTILDTEGMLIQEEIRRKSRKLLDLQSK